jgi:RNA polymerase sigma factor (sigma-70 family)
VDSPGAASDGRRLVARTSVRDEASLMVRIVGRDLRAFEDLYRAYHLRLTRFLLNMTHRPQLVEEVLDDTMLVVWNRPESYNGSSKLSTWIFAIAYRKALNAMRREDMPIEGSQDTQPSGEAGPELRLGQRQVREILLGAMSELSANHRAVVDLTYFHDIGYREIAEIMDCPVDTVKTRMFHARRYLKRRLAGRLADWL